MYLQTVYVPPSEKAEFQPAAVLPKLIYHLKGLVGSNAELDFSWKDDAITICDMRIPSALRYGVLYTRKEIQDLEGEFPDFKARVSKFMGS